MIETGPLYRWFEGSNETKTEFMERTGVKKTTLFDLLKGKDKDYGILTLQKIEAGTGGQVTVRTLMEWLNSLKIATERQRA